MDRLKADFVQLKELYNNKIISLEEYLRYERELAEQFVLLLEGETPQRLADLLHERTDSVKVVSSQTLH